MANRELLTLKAMMDTTYPHGALPGKGPPIMATGNTSQELEHTMEGMLATMDSLISILGNFIRIDYKDFNYMDKTL